MKNRRGGQVFSSLSSACVSLQKNVFLKKIVCFFFNSWTFLPNAYVLIMFPSAETFSGMHSTFPSNI